jgi:hypothetical protein
VDFYVDTSFKEAAIEFDVVLAGILDAATSVVQKPTPPEASKGGGGGGSLGFLALLGLMFLVGKRAPCARKRFT